MLIVASRDSMSKDDLSAHQLWRVGSSIIRPFLMTFVDGNDAAREVRIPGHDPDETTETAQQLTLLIVGSLYLLSFDLFANCLEEISIGLDLLP
jgi:hypothetical protein